MTATRRTQANPNVPSPSRPASGLGPDAEDSKRAANRLAQRKFRRQRKDYIAHLERELALCREGADAELVLRRQQIERLNQEKAELRDILEQVAVSLGRICQVEVTVGTTLSESISVPTIAIQRQSQTQAQSQMQAESRLSPSPTASPPPDGEVVANDERSIHVGSFGTALEINTVEPACPNSPEAEVQEVLAEPEHNWPAFMESRWDHVTPPSECVVASPSILKSICCPGCSSRQNSSDKTQLMSVMLRRRVEDMVHARIRTYQNQAQLESQPQTQFQLLQNFEHTLVTELSEAIISAQMLGFALLAVPTVSLAGGSAWVLWQIAKTFWVLPHLADAGLIAQAAESGFQSDLFQDTMPQWLRPTDTQKTFEHHPAIDFIPWAPLREALVMQHDRIAIDDIFVNLLSREMPTGADADRPVEAMNNNALLHIRTQFQSREARLLRDIFYSSTSMFLLDKSCDHANPNCMSLAVDDMMKAPSLVTLV